jgi:hypothetical protein
MNSETLMMRCGATRFFTIFGRGDYLSGAGRCAVEFFFFFFFFFFFSQRAEVRILPATFSRRQ